MIYTGYYNKIKDYENAELTCIAISGAIPEFYNCDSNHLWWKWFAPSKDIFYNWKNGNIDDNEYTKRFIKERLNILDINKIKEDFRQVGNCILLCYEKEGFCHRHIVAEWLSYVLCYEVKEFKLK